MNITQVQENVEKVVRANERDRFIYDLLLAYGLPKTSVSRLENGTKNLSKDVNAIIWKKKLYYKFVPEGEVSSVFQAIKEDTQTVKSDPRFVIVTDGIHIRALDTKTKDVLDIAIKELINHFDFFLPWAGMEKFEGKEETIADVRAADKMAKFYDEISKDNPTGTEAEVHSLNVFLSRMLFCFFAEDTGIFEIGQFTGAISSHTQVDGSDLNSYVDTLWDVMNTDKGQRQNLPAYLNAFPYVNGGLFRHQYAAPMFTRRSRQMAIDMGELDWKAINPDIFGSMIQAVITPEHRGGLGMHYTSVPNIMKVIEPLFLNELYEAYESAKGNVKKLSDLRLRISKIKIFDPACGSGNFLIIAFKELRKLEMLIIRDIQALKGHQGSGSLDLGTEYLSIIKLSQFYGIELDDFAHEVAILSLWLAEHQMNQAFFAAFGMSRPALPLMETGHIVHGNACRVDWEEICPKEKDDEIYILGNPPYLGFNERSKEQKTDMDIALNETGNIQRLDYIGCWFVKASVFISNVNSKYALVSTNSICQGEQVSLLWPLVFSKKQEIFFAFQPFKWSNNAKGNAGVTCVILGIQNSDLSEKHIYSEGRKKTVKSISPYLIEGNPIIMSQRKAPISKFPEMILGSSGIDGGHLILTLDDKDAFIKDDPNAKKFIKPFIGGGDFIEGTERFCLWIDDTQVEEALKIYLIKDRIEKCEIYRLTAGRDAKKAANVPHRFFYRKHQEKDAIILPMTSSERRNFLPVGFLTNRAVVSNGVFVIYNSEPFVMGILSSRIHMIWTQAVSGKLESRIRYSVNLAYNNFPFPPISDSQKQELEKHVYRILEEREKHSEKTLAQLYDPDKMPDGLREAHHQNDLAIERCYRSKPFESDEERLEYLFKMYEQMIEQEKNRGTLFASEGKSRPLIKRIK